MSQKKAIKHIRWYTRQVKQNPPSSDQRTQRRRKRLIQYKKGLRVQLETKHLTHSV